MSMKKFVKTGVVALSLAAVAAFTACSATTPSVKPYWYAKVSDGMESTQEILHYQVKSPSEKDNTATNSTYSVRYESGEYTVRFYNTSFDPEKLGIETDSDAYRGRSVYCLETELTVSGTYVFPAQDEEEEDQTKEFNDSVSSVCYFLSAADLLAPVYSRKEVHSLSPATEKPTKLEECFTQYDYVTVCDYGAKKYSYTDSVNASKNKTGKIEIPQSGLFIDNEELFLLGRALDVSSSNTVQVFSPYLGKSETVVFSAAQSTTYAEDGYVFRNDKEDKNMTVDTVNLVKMYNRGVITGNPQKVYYATDSTTENHRNVMIALRSPLPYNLGYLEYTLSDATFCDR